MVTYIPSLHHIPTPHHHRYDWLTMKNIFILRSNNCLFRSNSLRMFAVQCADQGHGKINNQYPYDW